MPRKSSTNTASLSKAISSIKQNVSPVVLVKSVSVTPRSLKIAPEQWTNRTVRLYVTQPTTSSGGTLTSGQIVQGSGLIPAFVQIRVHRVKAWNYSNASVTTNYIRLKSDPKVMETAVSTTAEDVGAGASLPGTSLEFPWTNAANIAGDAGIDIATYSATPTGNPASTQSVVLDVQFSYKLIVTN